MPWIEADEQWTRIPRLGAESKPGSVWPGTLDIDEGWAELCDVAVESDDLGSPECSELSLIGCWLAGVALASGPEVEVRNSSFSNCDLAQSRFKSIRSSRLTGSKLIGADLSGATISDVVFEQCLLRYANLRMAKLSRVLFVDCTFDEVDCFELHAEDVEFRNTKLHDVNVDRLKATRLDLRGATELALTGIGDLVGCLVSEHQLPALSYSLAHASGLGIEQDV